MNTEPLFACPRCDRRGFTQAGLRAHVCRGNGITDEHRQLTTHEQMRARFSRPAPAPVQPPLCGDTQSASTTARVSGQQTSGTPTANRVRTDHQHQGPAAGGILPSMPTHALTPVSPAELVTADTATRLPDAAPADPQAEQWSRARRYVEAATLFQRASLAAQIMAGMELVALHKTWKVRAGRPNKLPHSVVIKWEDAVEKELSISDQTASRWMAMAKAARPRLAKSDLQLGAILEKNPGALTPAEQELLKRAVHKISDGQTQLEFLLECGVTKAPQGSGARGGDTGGRRSKAFTAEMQADARRAATGLLIDTLTEELAEKRFTSADQPVREKLHGLLVDLSAAVGATL